MIEILEAKSFYRLTTRKSENYKSFFLKFLEDKKIEQKYIDEIKRIDFSYAVDTDITLVHKDFELTVGFEKDTIRLLFSTYMKSEEFNLFVNEYFE